MVSHGGRSPNKRNERFGKQWRTQEGCRMPPQKVWRCASRLWQSVNLLAYPPTRKRIPCGRSTRHLLRVTSLYMNRGQGFIVTGNKMEDRPQHRPDQLNCKHSYFGFYPPHKSKVERQVTWTDRVAHDRLWEIRPDVFNSDLSWLAMAKTGIWYANSFGPTAPPFFLKLIY